MMKSPLVHNNGINADTQDGKGTLRYLRNQMPCISHKSLLKLGHQGRTSVGECGIQLGRPGESE